MAVCKRCGKTFSYEKTEGICPNCSFYNRPEGVFRSEDDWMKKYNYEDNSFEYEAPRYENEEETDRDSFAELIQKLEKKAESRARVKGKSESHIKSRRVNGANQRPGRNANWASQNGDRTTGGTSQAENINHVKKWNRNIVLATFVLLVVTLVFNCLPTFLIFFMPQKESNGDAVSGYTANVTQEEWSGEGQKVVAGDITYTLGKAKVLFDQGTLKDLPAGEKCIGIWLESNEDSVNYDGSGWQKPYVNDGTDFREMIYTGSLDDSNKMSELETYTPYLSSFDQAGYAVYFVKAEATELTISIPCQTISGDGETLEYGDVKEIKMAIE